MPDCPTSNTSMSHEVNSNTKLSPMANGTPSSKIYYSSPTSTSTHASTPPGPVHPSSRARPASSSAPQAYVNSSPVGVSSSANGIRRLPSIRSQNGPNPVLQTRPSLSTFGEKSEMAPPLSPAIANSYSINYSHVQSPPITTRFEQAKEAAAHANLSLVTRCSYGVGHVLNDLTASCWFSYLLVFLRAVLLLSSPIAGGLLLLGQVADGCATPLVGLLSDRSRAGDDGKETKRRKWWIGFGSIAVACTFPFIFHEPLFIADNNSWVALKFAYFAFFIILFQFAWASVQVSHLALVPELTKNEDERVALNSLRSCFTILSNVTVFLLAWAVFRPREEAEEAELANSDGDRAAHHLSIGLNSDDADSFFFLAVVVVAIGGVFSLLFLLGTPEPVPRPKKQGQQLVKWYHWFSNLNFYETAIVYTCTRVLVNVSQTYMPLYLLISVQAPKTSIATVPLTVFGAAFVSTTCCNRLTAYLGSKLLTLVGCLVTIAACLTIYVMPPQSVSSAYLVAVLLGIGSGIVGVSALSLICSLISESCESGAFVIGSMSFVDKIANGSAIMIIEAISPACGEPNFNTFHRDVMMMVPGTAAIIAITVLILIIYRTGGLQNGYEAIKDCGAEQLTEDGEYDETGEDVSLINRNGNGSISHQSPPLNASDTCELP